MLEMLVTIWQVICTKSFKDHLKDPNTHSIFLQPTGSEELIKETDKMKNKTPALEIFKISMIKCFKEEIINGLAIIINKSIEEGVVPDLLEIAKVILIHKKMMHPYQATATIDQF